MQSLDQENPPNLLACVFLYYTAKWDIEAGEKHLIVYTVSHDQVIKSFHFCSPTFIMLNTELVVCSSGITRHLLFFSFSFEEDMLIFNNKKASLTASHGRVKREHAIKSAQGQHAACPLHPELFITEMVANLVLH